MRRRKNCAKRRTGLSCCLVSCFAFFALAGCGYKPPYSCVRVSGQLTYDDGSLIPADTVRVIFLSQARPIDPKTPTKNGTADVDPKTGKFDFATTFAYKDGIIAGEHKVVIQCIRRGQLTHALIADEYADPAKTPLKVRTSDAPFTLKVPRLANVQR